MKELSDYACILTLFLFKVMLQAFKEEPPLDIKCRDKFLILSTFLNEVTEAMDLHDLVN